MAQHAYKRIENNAVRALLRVCAFVGHSVVSVFRAFFKALTRQYTIVLIPHSEKKVHNFRLSFLTVFVILAAMTSVFASFVWLGMSYGGVQSALAIKDSRLKDAQANLDALRTQLGSLSRQQESFQAVLSSTLSSLGINLDNSKASSAGGSGDLASFFNLQDTATGTLQEINSMQQFTDYLAAAEQPIKEMGAVLTTQSSLLTEIPNIWPVAGGAGHISMMFGQNTHPFTGDQYIHKGLDISTFRQGDPILATADGQVVSVDYSPNDFGLYVTIKHKHGFYTRYAHMSSARVVVGQKVQQGDTIGAIGSTGLVTGPHLHYEIHIGSDVVDPYNYMNIRGVSISLNSGGTDAY